MNSLYSVVTIEQWAKANAPWVAGWHSDWRIVSTATMPAKRASLTIISAIRRLDA